MYYSALGRISTKNTLRAGKEKPQHSSKEKLAGFHKL